MQGKRGKMKGAQEKQEDTLENGRSYSRELRFRYLHSALVTSFRCETKTSVLGYVGNPWATQLLGASRRRNATYKRKASLKSMQCTNEQATRIKPATNENDWNSG